jgi:hypothetical protein
MKIISGEPALLRVLDTYARWLELASTKETEILAQQRAKSRDRAAAKRRLNARFPVEVTAEIDARPGEDASKLARWLQDHPKLAPRVAHRGKPMQRRSLAKKIIRYRKQK